MKEENLQLVVQMEQSPFLASNRKKWLKNHNLQGPILVMELKTKKRNKKSTSVILTKIIISNLALGLVVTLNLGVSSRKREKVVSLGLKAM
jgi:hypothetical protein